MEENRYCMAGIGERSYICIISAIEQSNKVLFIDTDALVTQFYMNFLLDPNIDKNKALSDAIDALNNYDLILFLEPDVAFVQDGDRSTVIQNNREKYSKQIKALLDQHQKQYFCIQGSYQSRFTQAVKAVNQLLQSGQSL